MVRDVPTIEEALVMIEVRRRLVFDLESFIRYKNELGPEWAAMRENWGIAGEGDVWHVYVRDGKEQRFYGPRDEFEDWQAAR